MRLSVVCLLAACNQVYGLDQTRSRDAFEPFPDEDQDGVADPRDNCVNTPNASQADRDGDAIGDACDGCDACPPCAVGPNHDEDGDHVADGCDLCPTNPAMTTDGDGDGIGEMCELGTSKQRRVFFDGFGEASPTWLERGSRWDVADDAVAVKSGFEVGLSAEYHQPAALVTGTEWFVEVKVHVPTVTSRANGFVLRHIGPNAGPDRRCFVTWTAPGTYRLLGTTGIGPEFPGPADGIVTLRLVAQNPIGAGHQLICSAADTPGAFTSAETGDAYPLQVLLYADTRDVAFEYVDVVSP